MSTPPAADAHRTCEAAVPEPSSEELDALLRELAAQPPGARRAALRDQVIRRLLPMARRVTRRFQRHGEEFDDLLQVASLGLIKAVDGYDPALGHAFLSYALPKVTGELRRHLRDRTATVRLPRPLQEASGRILQAVEELEQRLGGSSPTAEQIAAHTGLGQDRVLSALRAVRECRPRSLDEPVGEGQESSLVCLIGADDPALDRVVDTVSLAAVVKQLPERDRRVLYLRFYRERTQQQIADAVGVSQMQVSRILRRSLGRLRGALLAGEPCAGSSGEGVRGPVTGRAARPTRTLGARHDANDPTGPTASTGRALDPTPSTPPTDPTAGPTMDTAPRPPTDTRLPAPVDASLQGPADPRHRSPSATEPETPAAAEHQTLTDARPRTPADARSWIPTDARSWIPTDARSRIPADARPRTPADTKHRTPTDVRPRTPADTKHRTPTNARPQSRAKASPPAPVATAPRTPADPTHRTPVDARCRMRCGGARWGFPPGSRWRSCNRGAAKGTRVCPAVRRAERHCRVARPPPDAVRTKREHLPRPGLSRLPPRDTGASTRADEGAHRETSPARAPARMGVAGRPRPLAPRP